MNLSEHFTLEEMIESQTALRMGINNMPNQEGIESLKLLCEKVLEPVRLFIDVAIIISSGYRSKALNGAIGGVATSQHIKCEAADIKAVGMTAVELFNRIKFMVDTQGLIVDQCINEYDSWVHVSYTKGLNRKQFFKIPQP